MRLYLDSSVLVKLFKIETDSNTMVEILAAIGEERGWAGFTSQWSTLEIGRALKKDGKPRELILLNLRELRRHRVSFIEVSDDILKTAEDLVASYDLYASDALHVSTFKTLEKAEKLDGFLCDDTHFHRLKDMVKVITLGQVKVP